MFAPGGLVIPFTFTAIDDSLVEGDETVDLEVVNITSTAGLSTSDPVNSQVETVDGTITITDNDAAEFVISQSTEEILEEGETVVTFTISLVDPGSDPAEAAVFGADEVASVNVSVTGGSATDGVDYAAFADALAAAVASLSLIHISEPTRPY